MEPNHPTFKTLNGQNQPPFKCILMFIERPAMQTQTSGKNYFT